MSSHVRHGQRPNVACTFPVSTLAADIRWGDKNYKNYKSKKKSGVFEVQFDRVIWDEFHDEVKKSDMLKSVSGELKRQCVPLRLPCRRRAQILTYPL